jgi:hypothetical protein
LVVIKNTTVGASQSLKEWEWPFFTKMPSRVPESSPAIKKLKYGRC